MAGSMSSTRPTAGSRRGKAERLRALALALLLALAPVFAAADQNDPDLPALFERLRTPLTPEEAEQVNRRIWLLWLRSDDPTVNRLMTRGIAAMQRGALGPALAFFGAVTMRAPEFAEGWNKRATLLYLMGRHEESVAAVERVLALEPRHYGALSGLGMILVALDREAEALVWLRRALAINPHLVGVQTLVAAIEARRKGRPI